MQLVPSFPPGEGSGPSGRTDSAAFCDAGHLTATTRGCVPASAPAWGRPSSRRSPVRRRNMLDLRTSVSATLHDHFSDALPWDQNTGTAFAVELTRRLTPPATNLVFYGRPR